MRAKSKSYVNVNKTELLYGDNAVVEIVCHEIHAGGFRCIEEHLFQKSANYLRRTQSFQSPCNQVKEADQCQKKISLTDYVSARGAKSSRTSTPQPSNFNSYPNSVNSCDVTASGEINEEGISVKIGKF